MDGLPALLDEVIAPQWQARHLMSAPARYVEGLASLSKARDLLTRYNINALLVVEGADLKGYITRQTVERAIHHGLSTSAVRDYMSTEFGQVPPDADLSQVQQLIVEQRQRFVPVVDGQAVVGVITRADLLRHLVSGGRALRQNHGSGIGRRRDRAAPSSCPAPDSDPAAEADSGVAPANLHRCRRSGLPCLCGGRLCA